MNRMQFKCQSQSGNDSARRQASESKQVMHYNNYKVPKSKKNIGVGIGMINGKIVLNLDLNLNIEKFENPFSESHIVPLNNEGKHHLIRYKLMTESHICHEVCGDLHTCHSERNTVRIHAFFGDEGTSRYMDHITRRHVTCHAKQ